MTQTSASELEAKYPRIINSITLMWGYEELGRYLDQLLFADREKRQGFPPEVMDELMFLHALHVTLTSSRAPARTA